MEYPPPSHRERYPEQYSNPLVGRVVRCIVKGEKIAEGRVSRVLPMYGGLVEIEGDKKDTFRHVRDCEVITLTFKHVSGREEI
jgi:hypothetical protein